MSFLTIQKFSHRRSSLYRIWLAFFLLVVPFIIIAAWTFLSSPDHHRAQAASGINHEISYQGKIANSSSTPLTGDYNFKFAIYNASTSGSNLWEETWATSTSRVSVTSGIFSTLLGTYQYLTSNIFNNDNLYLEVSFDSNGDGTYDQVFAPRKKITSAPYAFNSDTIDGFDASTTPTPNMIPVLDSVAGLTLNGVTSTNGLNIQGITVLSTTTISGMLNITNQATTTFTKGISIASGGIDLQGIGCFSIGGVCITSGGPGSSQWSDNGSMIYYSLGNVGIGTSSPNQALDVNGNIQVSAGNAYMYDGIKLAYGSTTLSNYFFGGAGNSTMTGDYNTALGFSSLWNNTIGRGNTALGISALPSNITGVENTAVGMNTLWLNTSGGYNTANGVWALAYNSTGSFNTAVGYSSLSNNVTGIANTALGSLAGLYSIGTYNLFLGAYADVTDAASTTALYNAIAIGVGAKVGGSNMMVLGDGNINVGIGTSTPVEVLDVYGNIQVSSGNAYKLNGVNLAYGSTTLHSYYFGESGGNINDIGQNNVASGYQTLYFNTNGSGNVANGRTALYHNTTGDMNVANGMFSLQENTIGDGNVASGYGALGNNTIGSWNVAYGYQTLSIQSGQYNVAVGSGALGRASTSTGMTAIGSGAGTGSGFYPTDTDYDSLVDTYSTFIGYSASRDNNTPSTTPLTNATAIGYNAKVGASSSMALGGVGAYAVKVGIGTSTPSEVLDVYGNIQVSSGNAYKLNGVNLAYGSTTKRNYLFGGAGNTTMTGTDNLALGSLALNANISGISNIAIGSSALKVSTSSNYNIAVGSSVLISNTRGEENVSMGHESMLFNTEGSYNTAYGSRALFSNTIGNYNTAIGDYTLFSNTLGASSIAIGAYALYTNTTGQYNTAIGVNSLYANTIGTSNTAIGISSLSSNTEGYSNTAIGSNSLMFNTTGSQNIGIGLNALYNNLSGSDNVANGVQALLYNTTGHNNVAMGNSALQSNTIGVRNVAIGNYAGSVLSGNLNFNSVSDTDMVFIGYGASRSSNVASTTALSNSIAIGANAKVGGSNMMVLGNGSINVGIGTSTPNNLLQVYDLIDFNNTDKNTKIGYRAGKNIVVGAQYNTFVGFEAGLSSAVSSTNSADYNSAFGYQSFYSNNTGYNNTVSGYQSLYSNTSGYNNTVSGYQALYHSNASDNTAIGYLALHANTSATGNSAVGSEALTANTTGGYNSAFGDSALHANTTGGYNSAFGLNTLASNVTGTDNVAMGYNALIFHYNGNGNVAVGSNALVYNYNGEYNVANGYYAGYSFIGSDSIFLGPNADVTAAASTTALTNAIAIGSSAKVGASNSMVLGGVAGGGYALKVGIGTSTPNYTFQVYPSASIQGHVDSSNGTWSNTSDRRLKTNITSIDDALNKVMGLKPVHFDWLNNPVAINGIGKEIGFIAQDVEDVAPELVDTDSSGMKSLSYAMFAPLLAGAIQQQQTQIDDLTNLVNSNLNVSFDNNTPLSVSDFNSAVDNLRVTQSASFYGTITVIGEAGFRSKVTFEKDVEVRGKLYVDKDQAGTVIVLAGSTTASVIFNQPYNSIPKIVANLNYSSTSPTFARFAVADKSTGGFSVIMDAPATVDLSFDWMALGVNDGNGQVAGAQETAIIGCMDETATNYNSLATQSDSSCSYNVIPPAEESDLTSSSTDPIITPSSTEPIVTESIIPIVESTSTTP